MVGSPKEAALWPAVGRESTLQTPWGKPYPPTTEPTRDLCLVSLLSTPAPPWPWTSRKVKMLPAALLLRHKHLEKMEGRVGPFFAREGIFEEETAKLRQER